MLEVKMNKEVRRKAGVQHGGGWYRCGGVGRKGNWESSPLLLQSSPVGLWQLFTKKLKIQIQIQFKESLRQGKKGIECR